MAPYKREFIEFALDSGVLRFGEFVLKSGRTSPYFFNSAGFATGLALARLGRFYADAVVASGIAFDMLFGPAYKGIPLVSTVAVALAHHHGRDLPYAFNRKEAKDHGEGGIVVGAEPDGRVLIVDDVISAGTAMRESVRVLAGAGATCVAAVVCVDRQERGRGPRSAVQEAESEFGIRVVSIVCLDDLVAYLEERAGFEADLDRVQAYRAEYGVPGGA